MLKRRSVWWVGAGALALVAACSGIVSGGGDSDGADDGSDGSDGDGPGPGPGPNPTPPPDPGQWGEAVNIRLTRLFDAPTTILFGVPVPPGVVIPDAAAVKISLVGGPAIEGPPVPETLALPGPPGVRPGPRPPPGPPPGPGPDPHPPTLPAPPTV